MRIHGVWVLTVLFASTAFPLLSAADTTPSSTPVVTDTGTYTSSTITLQTSWTSSDAESGISEYQYLIRQDSTSGAIIVPWTSTGINTSISHTGLSLLQGKRYYFGVKARNGAGLWSLVGYSNGIRVDATSPSYPGTPTEGSSSVDLDYDDNGSYTVYWTAASDAESGILAYEIQESVSFPGAWVTLTSSRTSPNYSVSGRLHWTRYFYRVRAKNGSGLWGNWSNASDGVLIDKTAPSAVTVTDDGVTTYSTTSLHATWTTSSDVESGIVEYQYRIRQDSTSGTVIVNWTSVGLSAGVTKTSLSLIVGKKYYFSVRAKNGAGLYSSIRYSDGILVQADTTPPTGTIQINSDATYTNSPTVTLALSAVDPQSGMGPGAETSFSNDGITYAAPGPYASTNTWILSSGDGEKTVYVKLKDAAGNWSTPLTDTIVLDTSSPTLEVLTPSPDSEVTGAAQ